MTGVFTDNQPDFSWILPDEERTFTQYFMPYTELGLVKNATKDALVNLEADGTCLQIKVYTTARYDNAVISVHAGETEVFSKTTTLTPAEPYQHELVLKNAAPVHNLVATVRDAQGNVLVQYQPEKESDITIPEPAKAAADPADITSIEQLFLTGLHIEQYRHATFLATDYYEEALRREPTDVRNNNAMGLWYLKRGQFSRAEAYFRRAIATLIERNPNPYDGEPYFNLGLCLFFRERYDEAYEAWYKSAWNSPMQAGAYLNLARLAVRKGQWTDALDLVDKALVRNYVSQTARHLKAIILRQRGDHAAARHLITESLALDKFSYGLLFEAYLLDKTALPAQATQSLADLKHLARNHAHTYETYAFDYAHAGRYEEAIQLLEVFETATPAPGPMLFYYKGYFASRLQNPALTAEYYTQAARCLPDYCFPNRVSDVVVLQHAMQTQPGDALAPYYLGNFWYAHRQYADAIQCWETSVALNAAFATVHRNLALAYHNKQNNPAKALASLQRAFSLNPADARVFMELDQLYKKLNRPYAERLTQLETHLGLTEDRDDLALERITLYNLLNNPRKALDLLASRHFHPWEGGEGKVVGQYLVANVALAKEALANGSPATALQYLDATIHYPNNLGEGKIFGTQENDIDYWRACAYEALGDRANAKHHFEKATVGLSEPGQAIFYNDQQPDKIFYQGMAHKSLGNVAKAESVFQKLIAFGSAHMDDVIKLDYFAVSLPDLAVFDQDLDLQNKIHCHYLAGLGYLGLGDHAKALKHFDEALKHNINHQGALTHKQMIAKPEKEMQYK